MADEQFQFAINKWDVTKNSKNKNKKQVKTKKKETNKQQLQNTQIRTVSRKQSKQIVAEKTKQY